MKHLIARHSFGNAETTSPRSGGLGGLLILLLASCSSDTEQLPAGKYPLEIAAANISVAQTRATADGTWAGNETVGLTVNGSSPYTYTADEDGKLTSTSPYYWQNTDDITVTAWYPSSASSDGKTFTHTIETDQSGDGYQASDFLKAEAQTVSFASPTITFEHQVAKVSITLTAGKGTFTDTELSGATVSIYDGTQWITANHVSGSKEYNALVLPTATDIPVSTAFVKVNIGNVVYLYSLSTARSLAKGNVYSYTLALNQTGLELTSSNITAWTNDSETPTMGKTGHTATISVTDGKLTQEMIDAAVETGEGNVTITGTLTQDDFNLIFTNLSNFVNLDMGAVTVSGTDVQFGKYSDEDNFYFYSNYNLQSIVLPPKGITKIGKGAFCYCHALTSITIPEGVTSIGAYAFFKCTSLTSVTIPEGVTTIGDNTFCNCYNLTSITIPSSVTSIGEHAFELCESLTSIIIPSGVTSIGIWVFASTSLTSITIPSSVASIGDYAFNDCTSLTAVTCEATTPPTIGNSVFGYYDYENSQYVYPTIYVPEVSVETYKAAENWSFYADYIKAVSEKTTTE